MARKAPMHPTATSRYFMPPYPDPKPPVSRTGAGDAFSTGFFCALIYGLPVHEALRWAPIESMHVVQFFGAQTGLLDKAEAHAAFEKGAEELSGEADLAMPMHDPIR